MIFFTSDYHIGHHNIIAYSKRPFQNVEEMNREIIARHNAVVKANDTVYNIGDVALNEKYVPDLLKQLNGTQHLVCGNHDGCHSRHGRHKKKLLQYKEFGFASVQEQLELQICNRTVLLMHMPYRNENDKDQRYAEFRPVDKGQFLLCGHVHDKWKINGRQINIGIDQWNYAPVSETEICDVIADIIEFEQV